jgi:hypothetical protein
MKKYRLNNIPVFIIGLLFLISCNKDQDSRMPEMKKGVTPYLQATENSDGFIDFNDPEGFNAEFIADVLFPDPFQKLSIVVVRNSDYAHQYIVKDDITSVPQTINISANDLVSVIPELSSPSDIQQGDSYRFFVNTTLEDGSVLAGYSDDGTIAYSAALVSCLNSLKGADASINVDIIVPCETALKSGTYSVIANGTSTDPGASSNPTVDYPYEVTLTEAGNFFTFTISDFSGGLFTLWYNEPYGLEGDSPGTIQDICGDITFYNTTTPFGTPVSGTVTVDEATGVITIEGMDDVYGDIWTLVLTPVI